jgi:hypothetical protein
MQVHQGFLSRPLILYLFTRAMMDTNKDSMEPQNHTNVGNVPKSLDICYFLAGMRGCSCWVSQKLLSSTRPIVHLLIHTRQKPFTWSTCDKVFSHKTNLWAHERIRTGKTPYTCSFGQRSYPPVIHAPSSLEVHQKIRLKSILATP